MPTQKNYYQRLGVSYYASPDEVRKGCERRLAALDRMRPDGATGIERTERTEHTERAEGVADEPPEQAAERRDVMAAYMTLKDAARRNAYNATLAAASNEAKAERERENNAGLMAAGWDGLAAQASKSGATLSQANADIHVRTDAPAGRAVVAEEPVDLRAAAQQRMAERARAVAERGQDGDNSQWVDDATLGVRYVAMTLDSMIVTMLILLAIAVRGALFANATPWFLLGATPLILGACAVTLLYYAWGECGRHRATLGKRMMGLRVDRLDADADAGAGAGIGVLRAAARYGLRLVGSYGLMLGYLMAFFTERKQALHDKLTDTLVVSVRPPLAPASLMGVVATVVFLGLLYAVAVRVAANFADGLTPAITQALGPPSFDPGRATPSRDDATLAYFAALTVQRAASHFHSERGAWPGPADVNALVASTAQPEALAQYPPKFLPFGMFAVSLGATAKGTAYLLFTPDDDVAQAAWSCVAIHVDAANVPNSCAVGR
jgi:uncharacterized RDD family membrane protein YckC